MSRRDERAELAQMSLPELRQALTDIRTDQFQNRVRMATHTLETIEPLRKGRKRIARILTYIRQRELAGDAE